MNFDDLLKERIIEQTEVSNDEIAYLFEVARRDINTAQGLIYSDLDWAFAIAYNSVLQLSIAYMNYLGFRPRGATKHVNTFKFMEKALSEEEQPMIKRLQQLRRKRNATIYERAGLVSEKEAKEVVAFALKYYKETLDRLPEKIIKLIPKEE